ncbi:MAG: AMP-binding protein [Beijerinckiaceae bacterium]|nr:AMP-binding protein [Beijerinckiaceae bacterium]
MMIGGSLDHFAARKPNAPAIICDEDIVTWMELSSAVNALAIDLDERCADACTVALVLRNSPLLLACFLACARTGREAAVLDASWPEERIRDVLQELSPALVLCETPRDTGESIVLDSRAALPRSQASPRHREPNPQSSFYVGFTSGSTGRPKGYRRSHGSWLESFAGDKIEFGMTERDVVLAPGSMTHSLFLYGAIHALHIGAGVLMARGFQPAGAMRMALRHGATVAYAAPTQWRLMLDAATGELPDLRLALSSGAKWFATAAQDIQRVCPNARFAEFYGASELSFISVRKSDEACPASSVGRAFANVNISIRDDDGRLLSAGEPGRIFVKSPYVFSGYAVGSNDIISCGDELSVGDLGFLDESGFLHLLGRADRMIVTSGKNVFPEEVERALESLPGVATAAVLGLPDALRGQKIVALLRPEPGAVIDRTSIVKGARRRLPAPFIPREFGISSQWRWTSSGKTDFNAMRSLWESGSWEPLP